jgi:hypothetical protein
LIWPQPEVISKRPFDLLLDYSKLGFLIGYSMPQEMKGENYVGCPAQANVYLWLWSPEQELPLKDILSKSFVGDIDASTILYFKPVEKATKMTLVEFYNTFKNADNQLCLTTPSTIWPSP